MFDPDRSEAEGSFWDVRGRLEENFRRVETLLREMEAGQDSKMRLAAAAELRQHLALAEKTLQSAAKAESVRAFEEIVIQALAEASATVRRRVVEKLRMRVGHGRDDPPVAGADGEAGDAVCAGADG